MICHGCAGHCCSNTKSCDRYYSFQFEFTRNTLRFIIKSPVSRVVRPHLGVITDRSCVQSQKKDSHKHQSSETCAGEVFFDVLKTQRSLHLPQPGTDVQQRGTPCQCRDAQGEAQGEAQGATANWTHTSSCQEIA